MPCEADILEDYISGLSPDLLNALLKDHTTSKADSQRNIFWATADYEPLGVEYEYDSQILPELITGRNGYVIMPRVLKTRNTQRDRSRDMAEVFTPSWICNAQNNLIDNAWFGRENVFNHDNDDHTWISNPDKITFPEDRTWRDYVRDTRLEITCGEAPYLVSRYDTATGQPIPLDSRIGILDRKLRVIGENTDTSGEWLKWAQVAFQSTYGYEFIPTTVFIRCTEQQRMDIVHFPFINRFMVNRTGAKDAFNRSPIAKIPTSQIDKLKFMVGNCDEDIVIESLSVRLGDEVEVVRGGLKGLIGNVEEINNETRILIRIDALDYAGVKVNSSDIKIITKI